MAPNRVWIQVESSMGSRAIAYFKFAFDLLIPGMFSMPRFVRAHDLDTVCLPDGPRELTYEEFRALFHDLDHRGGSEFSQRDYMHEPKYEIGFWENTEVEDGS